MSTQQNNKSSDVFILISGRTLSGGVFRPSNWAERLSGNFCILKGHQIVYSPYLEPCLYEGVKALRVNTKLQAHNPDFFKQIMDFAHKNKLTILDSDQIK